MKSKDLNIFRFESGVYPRILWIAVTTEPFDEFTERVFEDGEVSDIPMRKMSESANGETTPVYSEKEKLGGIAIRFRNRSLITFKTVAHESVHAANMIFKYCGCKVDTENDEAYAYLVGWIAKCCDYVRTHKEGGEK